MTNPYTSPKSTEAPNRSSRKHAMRRSYFLCVIAAILGTSFLLEVLLLPSPNGLGFLVIALGPFTLYFHWQWMGVPRDGAIFGILTVATTFLFLVAPNRITLAVSIAGGVAWAFSGYFWIAMLA